MDDRDAPPPYLGDYPNGAYWAAAPNKSSNESSDQDPDDYTVDGEVIRFMWDYGVIVPLWDAGGLLPEQAPWLRETLGLSDDLIEALTAWGHDMNHADSTVWARGPRAEREQTYRELDARARDLVDWLRRELAPRYEVTYKPW